MSNGAEEVRPAHVVDLQPSRSASSHRLEGRGQAPTDRFMQYLASTHWTSNRAHAMMLPVADERGAFADKGA